MRSRFDKTGTLTEGRHASLTSLGTRHYEAELRATALHVEGAERTTLAQAIVRDGTQRLGRCASSAASGLRV